MAIPDPHPIMFVQDRSPIHTARIVSEWFREHPEIILINWPSKRCDINPIENLWGIMKSELEFGPARKINAIDQTVRDVWGSIRRRPNICQRLVECMPNRINEVVDRHGGWTHC